METFEQRLTGGHPNSLGNTVELVEEVLADPKLFDALFHCYFSKDEVVRLRVSNAMKRICRANIDLLLPYIDRFLDDISKIDQASTQWTLSQLFLQWEAYLTPDQKQKALGIMQTNLTRSNDWIVLCQTMETLGKWAKDNDGLRTWLLVELGKLAKDKRKSVSGKAIKTLALFETP